jgi:hypothetical protein
MVRSATAAPYLLAVGHHDARGDGGAEGGDVGGGQGVALELRLEARPDRTGRVPARMHPGRYRAKHRIGAARRGFRALWLRMRAPPIGGLGMTGFGSPWSRSRWLASLWREPRRERLPARSS